MSSQGLKSLTIEHLRGATKKFVLPFEKGRKLSIIYGENGSGKTTICDALELLGKGKIGSLENKGLGKTPRYWHSVGKSPSDVAISLETETAACTGKLQKTEIVVSPAEERPKVEVLRRTDLLKLVEANPATKYEAVKPFLDVSGVESSESSLRELVKNLNRGRETAVARVQENQDALDRFWEAAGKSGASAVSWAEAESKRDTAVAATEAQAITNLREAYQNLGGFPERAVSISDTLSQAQKLADEAATALNSCLETVAEGTGEVLDILHISQGYLAKHPECPSCPLCESSENISGLAERIGQRMSQFSALQTAKSKKSGADNTLNAAKQRSQDLDGQITQAIERFESSRKNPALPKGLELPTASPSTLLELSGWFKANEHLPPLWQASEIERRELGRFITALKGACAAYRDNVQGQKDLDLLLPKLERALEIVTEERQAYTDHVLRGIATEVGRLYEIIHPGEGLDKISLALDPDKRASLEITADFYGEKEAPPQAYFSQSHLDTLGLCIFFALAGMDSRENTILVLDDVLTSIDEPHVDRLIEMVYAEALAFRHCVITTHYRPWKQKLKWGWLQSGQCQFIELTKWTAIDGLTLIRAIPDIERLGQLLAENPADVQLVCAKSGVVLEAILDFLTVLYECPVPRRPNGLYTLGDLLPAIDKKLRAALRIETLQPPDASGASIYTSESLTPIFEELIRIAQARNVFGCHFSAISFDLLETDGLVFGQQVLNLAMILIDPVNGWPRNDKSGSYWKTANDTRRLHPLKRPI